MKSGAVLITVSVLLNTLTSRRMPIVLGTFTCSRIKIIDLYGRRLRALSSAGNTALAH